MNNTIINILQQSPHYFLQQQLTFEDTITTQCLMLTFDLILLSALNHAKLPQISLFTIIFQSFTTQIKLKVSNQFDFYRMKYDSEIEVLSPKQFVLKNTVQIDNYNHAQNKVQKVKIKYEFNDHEKLKSFKKTTIRFNFGNFNNNQSHSKGFGRFSLENFICNLERKKNLRQNQEKQIALINQQIKRSQVCNHEDEAGSFPILYMNEYENLKSFGQRYFNELIQNLQPYNAANTSSKPNHLFICHDMKGGYAEDTKFTNPVEETRKNSYRYNFFWYTSIFNYFSHQTITIPPRHWRQLCKRYQVKCLGTFIIENGRVDEKYFLTNQFALKLIFIAKKYQFDGYLINIENEIKKVEALKAWLGFLTTKIHNQIPGSQISWYDSVTVSGTVEYQNQIDDKNKIFYDLTDSFYTNYWWTDEMLKKDLTQSLPNKTIYVGNDVWGRGTYGGGQFDIYKAIDEIQKMNRPNQPNLVPALFAPGYTYETGGQNNNPYLKANQDRLYRGVIFDTQEIKEWIPLNDNGGNVLNLKKQKQWFGKYYAMNMWPYSNKGKLKIMLVYRVNNTQFHEIPRLDYKIFIRLQNKLLNQAISLSKIEKENAFLTQKDIKKIQIMIQSKEITPKTDLEIYIATTIKDVFDDEKILISYYLQKIDWVQEVPVTKLHFNSPYNSFLNIGYGDFFYYKGNKIFQNYNYLADYDMPPTASLNHPFVTDIEHDDAYIGGSSLIFYQSSIRLFYVQMPNAQHSYPYSYQAKIVKKGGNIQSLYIVQSSGFSVYLTKKKETNLENGWTEQIYEITPDSMKKMKKKFFKDLQTSLMMNVKQKCIIGQIYLLPQFLEKSQKQKQMLELSIGQSFRTQTKNEIFIDIDLTQQLIKSVQLKRSTGRYLIVIDQQFSAFIYMDKGVSSFKGKLRQIKLKLHDQKSTIKIYDVDSSLTENLLLEQKNIDLSELKKLPISHKIVIKNY